MVGEVNMPFTLVTSWCLLLAAILPKGGITLKMVRVSVPQYTMRGESVELVCEFDLQGDRLYSVSWYKDHDEFYRYVPRGNPPQHTYKIDGIKVDAINSDSQKVVVRNVPLKASGEYRCEVSAEAPAFSSVHGEARMNVVALPRDGPEITGEQRNYQIGEEVSLNCTSAKSFPPARLRWYVNDLPVSSDYEAVVQQHGLVTSLAGLRFILGPDHFLGGRLQIRCVATISAAPVSSTAPTIPAPAPVLHSPEHHRLSASSPSPPGLDYNREAYFFVRGDSSSLRGSFSIVVTAMFFILHS